MYKVAETRGCGRLGIRRTTICHCKRCAFQSKSLHGARWLAGQSRTLVRLLRADCDTPSPLAFQPQMTYVQAVSGRGGWPMSVWLTPQLEPFYGGTYYPPQVSVQKTIVGRWKRASTEETRSGWTVRSRLVGLGHGSSTQWSRSSGRRATLI